MTDNPYSHSKICACALCHSEGIHAWDRETCSWCTTEVPDSTLTQLPDGARICQSCLR